MISSCCTTQFTTLQSAQRQRAGHARNMAAASMAGLHLRAQPLRTASKAAQNPLLQSSGLLPLSPAIGGRQARSQLRVAASASPTPPTFRSVDFVDRIEDWSLVGDEFKEADLKKLRSVYDFDLWRRHRSSSRYWRHMKGLLSSRVTRWVAAPLAYVMSVATAVAVYHTTAEMGLVPEVLPELKLASNATFGLTSFALSTLLVLRTNTSYQRWDEARKMWGLNVNRSRDITRMALGYIPPSQPELQDMFCRWICAYNFSLMCHLRAGEDLERELTGKLRPEELQALLAANHRPNYVMQVLTAIIRTAQLPGANVDNRDSGANVRASAAFRMDENLTNFADTTGGCERILRTPVPLAWTRHNSRFLMIWLTFLPFALWDNCHWAMLPTVGIISYLLLGIKEIGVIVEEPFSILPLETICRTIETNVWELHRMHSASALAQADDMAAAEEAAAGPTDAMALVNSVVPASSLRNVNGHSRAMAGERN